MERRTPTRYLSVDLEVGPGGIRDFAAVYSDGRTMRCQQLRAGDVGTALAELDAFAIDADALIGHNLVRFDRPHLQAAAPALRLLRLPALDTLMLSPLAFPRNPYHRLVKHYQDGGLVRGQVNDPQLDAGLTLDLFREECEALRLADPRLLAAWHWLTAPEQGAFDRLFQDLRGAPRPSPETARSAIVELLHGNGCTTGADEIVDDATHLGWPLAYALAWLSVAGGNSVMPPWVRLEFPEAGRLVRALRDTACTAPACSWCRAVHDPRAELKRWFGFDAFREAPATKTGGSMQQAVVEAAMAGRDVLALLPTGSGKSLCYQVPALSRYYKTGALTVVISPLVALMADQVAGLQGRGIGSAVTINGMLSQPERADALDRVRLGDAAILLTSPEQLRNRSVANTLKQREVGAWVVDEAHCLSSWGHDFRPDYRYIGRFIREHAGDERTPPVMCLTATAKPAVVEDILRYFHERLDISLEIFDGGAERDNLTFHIAPTTPQEKLGQVVDLLTTFLPDDGTGGAIVYCATRRRCEEIAEYLQAKGSPPITFTPVSRRRPSRWSNKISSAGAWLSSSRRMRSAWASTSRTCGLSSTRTCPGRSRTTCRRPDARAATPKRRTAFCCTRRTMSSGSSPSRPGRASPGARSTASAGRCGPWHRAADAAATARRKSSPPPARFSLPTRNTRSAATPTPTTRASRRLSRGWRTRNCSPATRTAPRCSRPRS